MKEVFNMFTNDVTQTYNHLNASAEIFIMLLGSFLLGCLLCWLLKQFFINNNTINAISAINDVNVNNEPLNTRLKTEVNQANSSSQNKINTNKKTDTSLASDKQTSVPVDTSKNISDFKIINGITSEIETHLRNKNINSYSDLRDIDNRTLHEILNSSALNDATKKTIKTWSHQAALAAKGDWRKLSEYQDFIEQVILPENKIATTASNTPNKDNLQKIKGIGPQIEKILNNQGIYTFKQLKQTDAETLKEHICSANNRFKNNQTATWSNQARMAENSQWKELSIYQEFMDDINIDSYNLAATVNKTSHATSSLNIMGNNTSTNTATSSSKKSAKKNEDSQKTNSINQIFGTKAEQRAKPKKHTENNLDEIKKYKNCNPIENKPSQNTHASNDNSQKDDLKLIEGIGPKIEEVLNKANIFTFTDLQKSDRDTLKSLLNDAGSQYRMHEPETWPTQAKIANKREWNKLKEYQEHLTGGREK